MVQTQVCHTKKVLMFSVCSYQTEIRYSTQFGKVHGNSHAAWW